MQAGGKSKKQAEEELLRQLKVQARSDSAGGGKKKKGKKGQMGEGDAEPDVSLLTEKPKEYDVFFDFNGRRNTKNMAAKKKDKKKFKRKGGKLVDKEEEEAIARQQADGYVRGPPSPCDRPAHPPSLTLHSACLLRVP